MMESRRNLLDILSSAAGEYLSLRTDDFRKRIVYGLSVGFSRILSVLVIVMLSVIVLAAFAFGFIVLLGNATGSWSTAAFIVGGVFMMGLLILFFLRKRLFVNMFAGILAAVADSGRTESGFNSIALMLVRNLRDLLG